MDIQNYSKFVSSNKLPPIKLNKFEMKYWIILHTFYLKMLTIVIKMQT